MMFLLIISFVFAEDELRYSTNPKSFSQDDGARLVYGTDYKIIKMKGNESNMPPVFEESSVNVSVDGDNTSIFERRVIICLDAKFESINTEKNVSKAKRVYTPPVTLNYLQNAEEKSVDRELKKRRSNTGKNFESGDSYLYCVSANPKTDFYFKFGDNTIEIIQSTTISTDLFLTNVTDEPIFTHLNISRSDVFLYMSFDKDNLTHTIDLSNNNFDGTNEGDAKNNAVGIIGKAISLDGSGDRINLGDVADNTGDNFTISAWIKTRDFSADGMIVAKKEEFGAGYYMDITFGGEFNAVFDDSLMFVEATSTTFVNDDAWHHLVAVRSGDDLEIYIDGVQDGSGMGSGIGSTANTANLIIGKSDHSMDSFFNGLIDQVIIFNTTLTSAEITNLYNNQSVNIFATTGTQHYKSFNESGLTDENQVNITTQGYERLLGTDISVAVGQWNVTDGYDDSLSKMVLSMHFDNNTAIGENNTHFVDSSSRSNNGSRGGSAVTVEHGKYDKAIELDGTNDYIQMLEDDDDFDFTTNLTLSAWVNIATSGASPSFNQYVIDKQNHYSLLVEDDETVSWYDGAFITTTETINLDTWHHLSVTFDEALPSNNVKIYIDGSLSTEGTSTSPLSTSDNPLRIGCYSNGGGACTANWGLDGMIDEVKIFGRVLTPNQIKEEYIKGNLKFQYSGDKLLDNSNADDNVSWNIFDINNATKDHFITRYTMHNNDNNSYTPFLSDLDVNFTFFFLEDVLAPRLNFTTPTPADTATVTIGSVIVNTSIDDLNLGKVDWEWNGTNYSMMNDSMLLLMNFNNFSELGEGNTLVRDVSRYQNDGVPQGTALADSTAGVYGGALSVDGTSTSFLELGATTNMASLQTNMTIAGWFYDVGTNDDPSIFCQYADVSSSKLVKLVRPSSQKMRYFASTSSGGFQFDTMTDSYSINEWHFFAVVVEGSLGSSTLDLYLDSATQTFALDAMSATPDTTVPLRLGSGCGAAPSDAESLDGFVDNFMIWNRSFTDDEIDQLYMSSLAKFNNTHWELYVNQSTNNSEPLVDGDYTYRTHAGDTFLNVNQTELRTVTVDTTPVVIVNTCNYGGTGNLECNCAVNNTLSSNIFGDRTGNFSARGDGTLTVNGTVTGFNQYFIGDGCIMYKIDGVTIGG